MRETSDFNTNTSMKERFIVKVQLPISTNTTPKALVYNEDRSIQEFVDPELFKSKMKYNLKMFFWAEINEGNELIIFEAAPWQTW